MHHAFCLFNHCPRCQRRRHCHRHRHHQQGLSPAQQQRHPGHGNGQQGCAQANGLKTPTSLSSRTGSSSISSSLSILLCSSVWCTPGVPCASMQLCSPCCSAWATTRTHGWCHRTAPNPFPESRLHISLERRVTCWTSVLGTATAGGARGRAQGSGRARPRPAGTPRRPSAGSAASGCDRAPRSGSSPRWCPPARSSPGSPAGLAFSVLMLHRCAEGKLHHKRDVWQSN